MRTFLTIGLVSLLTLSCGKIKRIDTSSIDNQRRANKIKHVTEKQLLELYTQIGESAEEEYNSEAKMDCQPVYPLTKGRTVEVYNVAKIDSTQLRDEVKGGLLEALKFSVTSGQKLSSHLDQLNDTLFVYSFPIHENAFLNKNCGNDMGMVFISKTQLINSL